MFSVEERTSLRQQLIAAARDDSRVAAAALVGSGARDEEDDWSDIDLALRLSAGADMNDVVNDWTVWLVENESIVDHLDVRTTDALYRVFLLASTLQVDLSFWPHDSFRPTSPDFRLLFGSALEAVAAIPGNSVENVRLAWLHALHVRSAIARQREWQAVWMLEGMRNQIVISACLRHGVRAEQGRGVDQLPLSVRSRLEATLLNDISSAALRAAFSTLTHLLIEEAEAVGWKNLLGLTEALTRMADNAQ